MVTTLRSCNYRPAHKKRNQAHRKLKEAQEALSTLKALEGLLRERNERRGRRGGEKIHLDTSDPIHSIPGAAANGSPAARKEPPPSPPLPPRAAPKIVSIILRESGSGRAALRRPVPPPYIRHGRGHPNASHRTRTMVRLLLLALLSPAAARLRSSAAAWNDTFDSFDSALWTQQAVSCERGGMPLAAFCRNPHTSPSFSYTPTFSAPP